MARVCAIIPTLGTNPERLAAAVEAVWAQSATNDLELVVVVNGPSLIEGKPLDARTRVVTAGVNLGWAGGLHAGRAVTDAEFLWLVQDDSYPKQHCLRELLAELDSAPAHALVSPLVVRTSPMRENSPTVPYAYAGSWGGVLAPDGTLAYSVPRRDLPLDQITTIPHLDYVPSRGMLIRTSVWDEVGGADLRAYPTGWVDVLLCTAVREAGYTIGLAPAAHITHDRNASTPPALLSFVRARGPRLVRDRETTLEVSLGEIPPAVQEATLVSATSAFLDFVTYVGDTMVPRGRHDELAELLAAATAERDAAVAQRDAAIAERDASLHTVTAMRRSRSWSVTAPMRKLSSIFQRRWLRQQ